MGSSVSPKPAWEKIEDRLDGSEILSSQSSLLDWKVAPGHSRLEPSDDHPRLLRGIFQLDQRSCDVVLDGERLHWSPIQPLESSFGGRRSGTRGKKTVNLCDVLSVKLHWQSGLEYTSIRILLGLTLFMCQRKSSRGDRLQECALHLNNASDDHCRMWHAHLRAVLDSFTNRPRSLKVIINSQCKRAPKLFEKKVLPLFNQADISTDVQVTDDADHASKVLHSCRLSEYDGVVCVGGDGTASVALQVLLCREQGEAWTNALDSPSAARLLLGIIPAGSNNVLATTLNGTNHARSAALHIILGHQRPVNVLALTQDGRPLRVAFTATLGFGGHSLAVAEHHQWLPAGRRKDFAVLRTITRLRPVDCEIAFLPSTNSGNQSNARTNTPQDEEQWTVMRGSFLNVNITAGPSSCGFGTCGVASRPHDGELVLDVVHKTSRVDFMKYLKHQGSRRYQFSQNRNTCQEAKRNTGYQNAAIIQQAFHPTVAHQLESPLVETFITRAVRVKVVKRNAVTSDGNVEESSSEQKAEWPAWWNVDGELLRDTGEIIFRVHSGLLTMYGGTTEETTSKCV
uniref:Ceramide kinase-like n=1 Tax=Eptatretus burgeri TaxID=7764 RepID=A0A8C4Q811_EPTBU